MTTDMSFPSNTAPLHRLAHARAGDKGNRLNVSVIAYSKNDFELLREQVTPQRVKTLFADRNVQVVTRYELPKLGAMNFVIDEALEGGVNKSLNLDGHGKSLSFRILEIEIILFS
ncbi:AtuA-related protein [Fodinicurvata sediminis]|uniref:AtuA-related protein n=1 Tax=Fodinicurvata sediminis TaxID=1121832 RepID=UPI0003B4F84B|nr:hypothetical protein [Fodinicurvata sediminis]